MQDENQATNFLLKIAFQYFVACFKMTVITYSELMRITSLYIDTCFIDTCFIDNVTFITRLSSIL